MDRVRGLLLKPRVNVFFRRRFSQSVHRRFDLYRGIRFRVVKPFSRILIKWAHRLRTKAKAILRIRGPVFGKPDPIPKGHVAVYVGQRDGEDFERIWVPVAYLNHPLFRDLLRESENEYGFDHRGGIIIPFRLSEFDQVQSRIKTVQSDREKMGSMYIVKKKMMMMMMMMMIKKYPVSN